MKMIKRALKKRIKIIIKLTKRHMKRNLNSIQVAITAAVWDSICIHLQTGEYSLSYELYFPSSSIDSSTVQISAASSVDTISKVTTNVLSDHSRTITMLLPID